MSARTTSRHRQLDRRVLEMIEALARETARKDHRLEQSRYYCNLDVNQFKGKMGRKNPSSKA